LKLCDPKPLSCALNPPIAEGLAQLRCALIQADASTWKGLRVRLSPGPVAALERHYRGTPPTPVVFVTPRQHPSSELRAAYMVSVPGDGVGMMEAKGTAGQEEGVD
jgi:hypothetical protein